MTDNKKDSATTEPIENKPIEIVPENNQIVNFDPQTLIAQAISQNVPVETMERLLAMRKELKAEWAKEQFDKAMSAFQAECPIIEKKKRVSFNTTNYSYAPLEDIIEQVKGILSRNGFSYTFDTKEGENAIKVICYAKHIDGHSESSSLEIGIDQASKMNKTQQYGSSNSYGKRYAFCNAFGILTGDEDTDTAPTAHDYSVPKVSDHQNGTATIKQKQFIKQLMNKKGYALDDLAKDGINVHTPATEVIQFLINAKSKIGPTGETNLVDDDLVKDAAQINRGES